MPSRDMAVATGALVLFRLLGSATGVAIGGTILNNQLANRLAGIPGFTPISLGSDVSGLKNIQPPALQAQVLSAYAAYSPSPSFSLGLEWLLICRSIDTIWIVLTPLAATGLACVLVARKYTLKRHVIRVGDQKSGDKPGSSGSDEKKVDTEGEQMKEESTV